MYSLDPSSARGVDTSSDVIRGSGVSAVFIARNRFAVLDKTHQVNDEDNDINSAIIYRITLPHSK